MESWKIDPQCLVGSDWLSQAMADIHVSLVNQVKCTDPLRVMSSCRVVFYFLQKLSIFAGGILCFLTYAPRPEIPLASVQLHTPGKEAHGTLDF
ncbi:hypothetical protein Tco_0256529 [Tanacetum coccineum]